MRKIIHIIGGRIQFDSQINSGTEFKITLKRYFLSENDNITNMTPSFPIERNSLIKDINDSDYSKDKRTIMLVEDNLEMLSYMQLELSKIYNVFVAKNGIEALEKIVKIPKTDIIISDIMMDGMDGYQLHLRLLENDNFNSVSFIFLTAKTSIEDKIKGLYEGAIDYISKPFSIEELIAKINAIIVNREKQKNEAMKESIQAIMERMLKVKDVSYENEDFFNKQCQIYKITERQKEIILLIANGLEYKEISDKLNISIKTTGKHIETLYEKTNVHNKVDLINLFFK